MQSVKFVSRSICCCLFPPCEQNAYLAMDSWQCVLRVFRTYTTWFFDISLPFSLFRSLQRPKPRDQKRLARSLPVFFFRDWVVAVLFEVNSISYCMIFVSFRGRWFRAFPARKWALLWRAARRRQGLPDQDTIFAMRVPLSPVSSLCFRGYKVDETNL